MKRSELARARKQQQSKPPAKDAPKITTDDANEVVVLAAACADAGTRQRLVMQIPSSAFHGKGHAAMWDALTELERQHLAYDPATIQQISAGTCDVRTLEQYRESRPEVPLNLKHHTRAILWTRTRVDAWRGPIAELIDQVRDLGADPDRVRALAKQVSAAFDNAGDDRYLRDPQQVLREMKANRNLRRGGRGYYPFGLPNFDCYEDGHPRAGLRRIVRGVAPGLVTVITGSPGSGKSTAVAALVVAQAEQHRRVLYGAWEQESAGTLELCAGVALGIERERIIAVTLTPEEEKLIDDKAEELSAYVRFLNLPFDRQRRTQRTNDESLDLIQSYITTTAADVFVADLWRRVLAPDEQDPADEEFALYRQQAMAQETKCHCILVHQQKSKETEARDDPRPARNMLKGSSAWIEVPDLIIGVHREGLWKAVVDETIELIVLKQREGKWPLSVLFSFDPERGTITNGRTHTVAQGRGGVDSWLTGAQEIPLTDTTPTKKRGRKHVP